MSGVARVPYIGAHTFETAMPHALLPRMARLHRSLVPTPFHHLDALSAYLGANIWCKRDDLTGFGFGGNKTRKLDFLIAEAVAAGATDIITTGGVQSNFCRMTAAYAARERIACHLVLGGAGAAASRGGNLALDALFGAKLSLVETDDWSEWEAEAAAVAQRLRNDDRKPWRLPIGGSTPVGAMGYVHAMLELLGDAARAGLEITDIVHASSSGGTQAGLLAGAALAGWRGRVHGIAVAKSEVQLAGEVRSLRSETLALTDWEGDADAAGAVVSVDERWIGEAYAVPSREGREAQSVFARFEGIVLDDVYTAKAAAALVGMCRAGEFDDDALIVFLHTGGSPQLFAER